MHPLDELIVEMELGKEATEFLEGNLGKCLVGMAQQEAQIAREELGRVDPDDKKRILELQRQVWNGEHFEAWLNELVSNGDGAAAVYIQQR